MQDFILNHQRAPDFLYAWTYDQYNSHGAIETKVNLKTIHKAA